MEKENQQLPYLVIAKDPGAANCLSPVVEKLKVNRKLYFFAKDKAREIFNRNFPDQDNISESLLVGTILASGTSDPDYEGLIIEGTKRENPQSKLILIEDFPGSLVGLMKKLANLKQPILPDLVFVTSRSSREAMGQRFFLNQSIVIPIGQPAFDPLIFEDTPKVNQDVRSHFSILPNDLLVSLIGIPSQDRPGLNSKALCLTVSALNSISQRRDVDLKFVYRDHPREVDPSQYFPILETACKKVRIINPLLHKGFSTSEITAASNLVVNTTSTVGLETALRGSRRQTRIDQTGWLSMHLLLPQTIEFFKRMAGSMPLIDLKATAIASGNTDVEEVLEDCLFNPVFQKSILDAQQGALRFEYRFNGVSTSTKRALLWLKRLAS